MRNVLLIAIAATLAACATNPPDMAKADDRRNCVRETGSRIQPPPGECNNLPGRSYSREDLDRTGATNTSDAIRTLDPAAR